jgi:hypothetical protein
LTLALASCSRGSSDTETTPAPAEASTEATPADNAGSGTPPEAGAVPPPAPTNAPLVVRNTVASADRELAQRLGLAPPDPLIVSDLLTHADIRELVGYRGELTISTLPGIAPSPLYNVVRLSSDGGGYGFAVQLWRDDQERQSTARFTRLQETYIDRIPEAEPLGNEAFRGEFDGIRHYVFLHSLSRSVATVSCQSDLCDNIHLRTLAERVLSRL